MKYNDNGTYKDIYVKAFDTLPVGAEVDYDGSVVPDGWTEVEDMSGSNENGNYIKFADGTMICYDTKYFSTKSWQTITYPVEYVSTPTVLCNSNSGTAESATLVLAKISNIGLTTFRTCLVLTSGYDNGTVNWIAIGRWK